MNKNTQYNWIEQFMSNYYVPNTRTEPGNHKYSVTPLKITNANLHCVTCMEKIKINNTAYIIYFDDNATNACFCEKCYKNSNYYEQ